jgi:hypothetical protein
VVTGHAEHQSVCSGSRFDEDAEIEEGPESCHSLGFQRLRDFVHFHITDGMIRIAVCVVIGNDMPSFFHSPLADQPAGRLWNEPDRYADKSRADPKSRLKLGHANSILEFSHLEPQGQTPFQITWNAPIRSIYCCSDINIRSSLSGRRTYCM